jgi:hypothetical protein
MGKKYGNLGDGRMLILESGKNRHIGQCVVVERSLIIKEDEKGKGNLVCTYGHFYFLDPLTLL